ncbi:GNAT family N-acetyltransferase [Paenibacillus macerans]|uniref:GNAT family N-acetyltransferase n=1 Tax=Paenibacillus macerans TaxID=44252 RepID=UPI00203C4137|nr:GNAT family N-acetyltransferase [Paenibacillus macerans]MCM3700562.1 GNAT family N-acetyltransferase [Paenibacillus macerans]
MEMIELPHPYENGMAGHWIEKHIDNFNEDRSLTLAIVHKDEKYLIGAISIGFKRNEFNLDYVIYSFLDNEWSTVRSKLESFLAISVLDHSPGVLLKLLKERVITYEFN